MMNEKKEIYTQRVKARKKKRLNDWPNEWITGWMNDERKNEWMNGLVHKERTNVTDVNNTGCITNSRFKAHVAADEIQYYFQEADELFVVSRQFSLIDWPHCWRKLQMDHNTKRRHMYGIFNICASA